MSEGAYFKRHQSHKPVGISPFPTKKVKLLHVTSGTLFPKSYDKIFLKMVLFYLYHANIPETHHIYGFFPFIYQEDICLILDTLPLNTNNMPRHTGMFVNKFRNSYVKEEFEIIYD